MYFVQHQLKSETMKILKFTTLLFTLSVTLACASEQPEKLLIGKWRLDTKASRDNFEKVFVAGDDPQADKLAKGMMEYFLMLMESTTTEYKQNGEMINTTTEDNADESTKSKISIGSWKITEDKKHLIVTEKNQESSLEIISITNEQMVLEMQSERGNSIVLIYNPFEK